MQWVVYAGRRLPSVHPQRRLIVCAGALIQPCLLELAAKPEATSATAEDELPRAAVKGGVPLPHHVKVAPAEVWGGRRLGGVYLLPEAGVVSSREHHKAPQLLASFLLSPTHQREKVRHQVAEEQPNKAFHSASQPRLSDAAAAAAARAAGCCAAPGAEHKGAPSGAGRPLSPRSPPAPRTAPNGPGRVRSPRAGSAARPRSAPEQRARGTCGAKCA